VINVNTALSPKANLNRTYASAHKRGRARFSKLDYIFWLMMLLISVPNVLEIWGFDTIFKPYRVVALFLALASVPIVIRQYSRFRRYSNPLIFALLYLAIVSAIFGGDDVLDTAPLIISCLALFFSSFVVTSRHSLVIGLIASAVSFTVSSGFGVITFSQSSRISGLFTNPNTLGYAGCFAILVATNRYLSIPAWARGLFGISTIGVIALTGSRGATLAAVAAVISQLWRIPRLFWALALVSFSGVLVGFAIEQELSKFISENTSVFSRFTTERIQKGGAGRLEIAAAAMEVSANHGFLGIGLGQFRSKYFLQYFQIPDVQGGWQKLGVHNTYLSLLCEWGVVGFACFAVLFARLNRDSMKLSGERDWILGYIFCSLLMGLSTDLLIDVHFWVMLGVCVQFLRFAGPTDHLRVGRIATPVVQKC
jgi:O-Antigen ligase